MIRRFVSSRVRGLVAASIVLTVLGLPACNRGRHRVLDVAYVSAPQAALRDQVAAIYNRVGNVKNGERVEVLEREKRFARVRTASGIEGWIEQRFLIDEKTFDGLQKLTADNQNVPTQAPGILRNDTNLHISPGRDTEHLYQLAAGAKVAILQRGTAEKQSASSPPARPAAKPGSAQLASSKSKSKTDKTDTTEKADSAQLSPSKSDSAKATAGPPLEDWWLVRDAAGRAGWVLARMVDVDAPIDIAQYAEGQRFVAFFVLDEVPDTDKGVTKEISQYLCLLTEPRDGQTYDYDQVRVFTWNQHKHRYETAYREHGLAGMLPVTLTKEDFGKEGTLPVFILRVKDDSGNVVERKYKLNTPIVRRVLAPGEVASKPARNRRR
jgi:SH3-like domain-containing protein